MKGSAKVLFTIFFSLFLTLNGFAGPKVHTSSKDERKELRKMKQSIITISLKSGYSYTGVLVLARDNGIAVWTNLNDTTFRNIRARQWEYLQPDLIKNISLKNNRIYWQAGIGAIVGTLVGALVLDVNRTGNPKFYAGGALAGAVIGASFAGKPPFNAEINGDIEVYKEQLEKLNNLIYKY